MNRAIGTAPRRNAIPSLYGSARPMAIAQNPAEPRDVLDLGSAEMRESLKRGTRRLRRGAWRSACGVWRSARGVWRWGEATANPSLRPFP